MEGITYIKGDATSPQAKGNKIIGHICNDVGGWGKGFVLAISSRWAEPEKSYREWYRNKTNFKLGALQLVACQPYIWVANMIGQNGIKHSKTKGAPVRYEAIKESLSRLRREAEKLEASVHLPRIGCGLAGGKWELIEPLIKAELSVYGIEVIVYDFE